MIEMDAARGLLERLHYWHSALQREYGVPVFGVCRIGNPRPDPEDARAAYYPLVLPCVHARASQAALEWMIKSINLLVTRDSLDQEEEDLLQEGLLALPPLSSRSRWVRPIPSIFSLRPLSSRCR